MIFRALGAVLGLGVILSGSRAAENKLAETRSTLEKWVETRQLTTRQKSDWLLEKETLQQTIALLEKELNLVEEEIEKIGDTGSQVDKEREDLTRENQALKSATEKGGGLTATLEQELITLSKTFPAPLVEKIEPLLKRTPQDPANTKMSLAERLQNVVGILNEVGKFNSSISVVTELRANASGEEMQVKTIYLGLAQAWFTDQSGEFCGAGIPSSEGWRWTTQKELAPKIAHLLAIYENTQPAAFVALPITIQ